MAPKSTAIQISAICGLFILLALWGIVWDITSGLLTSGIDGIMLVLVCAMMAGIFFLIMLMELTKSGILPTPAFLRPAPKPTAAAKARPLQLRRRKPLQRELLLRRRSQVFRLRVRQPLLRLSLRIPLPRRAAPPTAPRPAAPAPARRYAGAAKPTSTAPAEPPLGSREEVADIRLRLSHGPDSTQRVSCHQRRLERGVGNFLVYRLHIHSQPQNLAA